MKPRLESYTKQGEQSSLQHLTVELRKKPSYWHYHPQLELTYVLHGSGVRMVGDHVANFARGDLMLTGENLPHDFNMLDDSGMALFLVVKFDGALIKPFPEFAQLGEMFTTARQGILFAAQTDQMQTELAEFSDLDPAQQVICLLNILLNLSRQNDYQILCSDNFAGHGIGNAQLDRINRTLDFVNQHFSRVIHLSELAELTNMTEPSFSRWFTRTMDCNFINYLNKCRVEQAGRMLLESSQQIAHIAQDCGFETLSSFNRAFKKYKGTSPNKFRKQWRTH